MGGLIHATDGLVLLGPIVAVLVALLTRQVIPALMLGVVVAALLLVPSDPLAGTATLTRVMSENLTSRDNLLLCGFSAIVGVLVVVMSRAGGTRALVRLLEPLARTRRGGQLAALAAGILVFFDDYSSCLVTGTALAPVADRTGVSRAKLAFIVDSTAAPIASVALVSTWVGYQVGLLGDAARVASLPTTGMELLVATLPWRLYTGAAVLVVLAVAWMGRDLGPMVASERAAKPDTAVSGGVAPLGRAWLAGLPLTVLTAGSVAALMASGWWRAGGAPTQGLLASADTPAALAGASATALVVALVAVRVQRALTADEVVGCFASGIRSVGEPLGVLVLAWTLGDLVEASTGPAWLAGLLTGLVDPVAVPLLAFGVACLMSFSSGSSWFTMGALLPVAVPVAASLAGGDALVVVLTVAAVMDGALFGDHASPISDTTVLAAVGSGCNVMLHARTQMPYAVVMAVLTAMGFLLAPVSSLWIVWGAVGVGAFAVVRLGTRIARPA